MQPQPLTGDLNQSLEAAITKLEQLDIGGNSEHPPMDVGDVLGEALAAFQALAIDDGEEITASATRERAAAVLSGAFEKLSLSVKESEHDHREQDGRKTGDRSDEQSEFTLSQQIYGWSASTHPQHMRVSVDFFGVWLHP